MKLNLLASLFMMIFGVCFAALAGYYARHAWTKNQDEYATWRQQCSKSRLAKSWFHATSKTYAVWNDRILGLIGIMLGLFVAFIGLNWLLR